MIESTRYDDRIAAYKQRNNKRYRGAKGPITLHEPVLIHGDLALVHILTCGYLQTVYEGR